MCIQINIVVIVIFFNVIWQIKFFTVEAGIFVRHLRYFRDIESVRINQQIVDLLSEASSYIEALLEHTQKIDMPDQDVVDLIFDFDERQYSLRRFLECRQCNVSIELFIKLANLIVNNELVKNVF